MKRVILLILAGALVLLLAACDFGTGSVSAPGASQFSDDAVSDDAADNDSAGARFTATVDTAGPIGSTASEEIQITFSNGIIDADAVSGNVTIHAVGDATNAWEAWSRSATVPYTASVVVTGTESVATLTVDATSLTAGRLEVVIDSAITANNGARTLNQDGDDIAGEAEDTVIGYVTTANAAPTVGSNRNPTANFTIAYFESADPDAASPQPFNMIDGDAASSIFMDFRSYSDNGSAAAATAYDGSAPLPTADELILLKMSSGTNQMWEEVSLTIADQAKGVVQVTPSGGFEEGAFYQWYVNDYLAESAAWNGYIHTYNDTQQILANLQNSFTLVNSFVVDTDGDDTTDAATQVGFAALGGGDYNGSFEVTFTPGGSSVVLGNTVTTDLFKVKVDPDETADSDDEFWLSPTAVTETADNTFRLDMPSDARIEDDSNSSVDFTLYFYPGATLDVNGDTDGSTNTTDDRSYFDTTDGVEDVTASGVTIP